MRIEKENIIPLQRQFSAKNIILANGDFPFTQSLLEILKTAEYIICCDGAAEKLLDFGRIPDAVVGDLDSISEKYRNKLQKQIHFIAEQDTNDLNKAFNFAIKNNLDEITILAATGKREDHTLGNIFLLSYFYNFLPKTRIISDYGSFYCISGAAKFSVKPNQAVSIFAIEKDTEIKSKGLVWKLDGITFPNLYCATLNRVEENCKEIYLESSKKILVYLA
ncbi:MAG: thiamine diphosphokinase [Cardiobacteriaceae bacterium]|nr:thiamine diphosphokinase [Cardiobacteriaceae bacterium]